MTYVYKWRAEWEEFGESIEVEKYFSSHKKMKTYSAEHAAVNDWDSSYWADSEKIEVE